jgi:Skp family chaperone for outer membrane proteins
MFPKWKITAATLHLLSIIMCSAHAAENYTDRPTIANVFDVFEKYPNKIPQGTLVTFKKKESKFATKIVEGGIQARIFALDDSDDTPKPIDTKDNCNIFISYVFPLTTQGNKDVVFQKLDEGWLNPTSSEKSIKDGRYFIVFEKSGPTQEHFGLRPSDTKQYFESGFLLVVSDDGHANLEKVINEFNKRKHKLSQLRKDVDDLSSRIPCYRYTKFAHTNDVPDDEPQMVALCERELKIN